MMTKLTEASPAVISHFVTEWESTTPIVLDNEDQSIVDLPDSSEWVRVSIRHADRRQTSLGAVGNRRFTSIAICFISIFVTLNLGRKRLDELMEKAVEIFEGITLPNSTVSFREVIGKENPREDRYFSGTVEANFEYQEIR